MKRVSLFFALPVFVCLLAYFPARLPAQEGNSLDWDIDSIFDEPAEGEAPPEDDGKEEEPESETAGITVHEIIKQQGFSFDMSYGFTTAVIPGWREVPWQEALDHGYYLNRYFKLFSSISLDAQISSVFRARSTFSFEIPFYGFGLGDIFFDYIIHDRVFIRGGKYGHSWGISPNYGFTNLLARVPKDGYAGDSYILKADVPLGIGGFQALVMTRANLMYNTPLMEKEEFGYGGKYNLALRWVDFDAGVFYRSGMALRAFLSVKTSLWNTDLYTEGLFAIDVEDPSNMSGAGSFGFGRSFFDGKFSINGEFFYNAEKDVYFFQPETDIREAGKSPFIEGANIALNMGYRFELKGDPRVSMSLRYAPEQDSAQLVAGFSINPLPHLAFSLGIPMALGSKDGFYYKNTSTADQEGKPIPFCVIMVLTLSGGIHFSHYF